MYVGRIMHTQLITVTPDTPLTRARDILKEKLIEHLLVVNQNGDLVGIISDRDIKQSWASPATTLSSHELNYILSRLTAGMIMIKKIITIPPDTTIERAAHIMQENRISALPVIQDGKLVGIITTTDVMGVLLEAIGIDRGESTRFVVLVDRDRIGFVAEMTHILKDHEITIRSIVSWPDRDHEKLHHLVMRVPERDGEKAIAVLREGGFKVLTGYEPDLTPYLPASSA